MRHRKLILLWLVLFISSSALADPTPPERISQARAVVGILSSLKPPFSFDDVKNISIVYVDIPNHKYRVDAVSMNFSAPELGISILSSTIWRFDLLESWSWVNSSSDNSSASCSTSQLNITADPVFPDWSNFTFFNEASCSNPDSSSAPLCNYWKSNIGETFIETVDTRTPVAYVDPTFKVYLFAVYVAGTIGPMAFTKSSDCAPIDTHLRDLYKLHRFNM